MDISRDLALFVAGGALLLLVVGRLVWRGLHKADAGIAPVSEQWLAERRGKRPPE